MYGNGNGIYGNRLVGGHEHLVSLIKERQLSTGKPTCVVKSGKPATPAMELQFDGGFVVDVQSGDVLAPADIDGLVKENGLWVVDL